jgi:hypothetical protein
MNYNFIFLSLMWMINVLFHAIQQLFAITWFYKLLGIFFFNTFGFLISIDTKIEYDQMHFTAKTSLWLSTIFIIYLTYIIQLNVEHKNIFFLQTNSNILFSENKIFYISVHLISFHILFIYIFQYCFLSICISSFNCTIRRSYNYCLLIFMTINWVLTVYSLFCIWV